MSSPHRIRPRPPSSPRPPLHPPNDGGAYQHAGDEENLPGGSQNEPEPKALQVRGNPQPEPGLRVYQSLHLTPTEPYPGSRCPPPVRVHLCRCILLHLYMEIFSEQLAQNVPILLFKIGMQCISVMTGQHRACRATFQINHFAPSVNSSILSSKITASSVGSALHSQEKQSCNRDTVSDRVGGSQRRVWLASLHQRTQRDQKIFLHHS